MIFFLLGISLFLCVIVIGKRIYGNKIKSVNQSYASLLDNINGGMIVTNHSKLQNETILTYVSSGFTKMTGYTLEDIQNKYQGRYISIVLEEDRNISFDKFLQQTSVGNTYEISYRIIKKDNSILWVMDNGYLVNDDDGLRNHSIITDISTVKQQEEELRLSEKRFSIAINASSGALFEVDLKKQLYSHFENAERIFGVSSEILLDDTRAFSTLPYDDFVIAVTTYFFHPDDHAIALNAM
ncbi:MAG: PAS domain-containing protein, partial [Clostridia bacterium]